MEEEEVMDIEAIINETTPLLWTRKLTTRLLDEYKLHAPRVGTSIRSLNILYALIARNLRSEFKCEITAGQVGNKLKSIKRKFNIFKEKGRSSVVEFGPGIEEVMKIMDRFTHKTKRSSMDAQNEAAVQSIKPSIDQTFSVEIVDENMHDQVEVMDVNQFFGKKEASSSKGAAGSSYQDPLAGDEIFYGKTQRSDARKLNLLEKKIENQEKGVEERLRKNELIEERNRLIATLLTKKTRNDVIDAIRKDRLLYHQEMKELWVNRLEVEKQKLEEKKRKNDLLEERNKLMKSLVEEMNKKSSDGVSRNDEAKIGDDDNSQTEIHETVELE